MINSTQVSYFILGAYFDTESFKYLFFMNIIIIYSSIIFANVLLIVVICLNRSLHEPMYIFLCSLFVNELYGSTGLFPFLLLQILSDIHTVAASFCFLQIFCVYTYVSVEFTNLAVMSYDRYLAICCPLQYNAHMTPTKVAMLIAIIWIPPFFAVFIATSSSASLQLCGNIINKVYCDNYSIIKLACFDTRINNVYELTGASLTVCVPISMIFYTYMKILKVCFSGSQNRPDKKLSAPAHLTLPPSLTFLLSLYFLTCPPLYNPLMYGLTMSKIRIMCKSLLLSAVGKFVQLE